MRACAGNAHHIMFTPSVFTPAGNRKASAAHGGLCVWAVAPLRPLKDVGRTGGAHACP